MVAACGEDAPTPQPEPTDNPPTISLTAPTGGAAVQPGADVDITWTADDDNGVVGVDLYSVSGGGEALIADGVSGGTYTWETPDANLYAVRVKVVARDAADQTAEAESGMFAVVAHSARGYVTSETCKHCHITYSNAVNNSGHPYKLNKVLGGPPEYPHSEVPAPPPGALRADWGDIAYVIGGYGWKARFITADSGWIMTNAMDGVDVQYNLPRPDLGGLPATWSGYHATDTERKPYDCGACHTTGWQTFAENGGVNQDGLPGIAGTWEETGIQCEECHAPGATHVATQDPSDMTIDNSAALCGKCHIRGDQASIPVSGGYIRHHEQYNELLQSPHAALSCNDCHDPHIGVLYGNADAGGIHMTCEDCHSGVTVNHPVPVDCESCHMARATKSARAVHTFEGDVRTHLFRINADSTKTKDDMWDAGGGSVADPRFTLDFACYSCHKDPATRVGGPFSQKSLGELAQQAAVIHP
jgi:hypothetical protein